MIQGLRWRDAEQLKKCGHEKKTLQSKRGCQHAFSIFCALRTLIAFSLSLSSSFILSKSSDQAGKSPAELLRLRRSHSLREGDIPLASIAVWMEGRTEPTPKSVGIRDLGKDLHCLSSSTRCPWVMASSVDHWLPLAAGFGAKVMGDGASSTSSSDAWDLSLWASSVRSKSPTPEYAVDWTSSGD